MLSDGQDHEDPQRPKHGHTATFPAAEKPEKLVTSSSPACEFSWLSSDSSTVRPPLLHGVVRFALARLFVGWLFSCLFF